MKNAWILLSLIAVTSHAEAPKIDLPAEAPQDAPASRAPSEPAAPEPAAAPAPISNTQKDPNDKNWSEYDNRIVKAHVRVKTKWTVMEVKESETIGTASFTLSRLPLVTFAVVRGPMDGGFDAYLVPAALKPLYPKGYKKAKTTFSGREATMVRGIAEDGRMDESYFSTDGRSLYQVSFTAPADEWAAAEKDFAGLKRSFHWITGK